MHEGHRQRMLQRLETSEASLQQHEILEIILYNAIPRKNTNELAHELVSSFGSVDGVMQASFAQLKSVKGIGAETAAYLRCIGIINKYLRYSKETFPEGASLSTIEHFIVERLSGLSSETLLIFCIDAHNKITSCSRFTDFNGTQASIEMDKLNKLFAVHAPHGIVVAHNHPTADSAPSKGDDRFTLQLMAFCRFMHVKLCDHVIVGRDGVYSYFKQRRLDDMLEMCDINSFLNEKLKKLQ